MTQIQHSEPRNFAQVLLRQAEAEPDRVAFTHLPDIEGQPSVEVTFSELHDEACSIAEQLLNAGARHQPVPLVLPPGPRFVAGLFGCFYAGAIAVPSPPPSAEPAAQRLANVLASTDARVGLTSESTRESLVQMVEGARVSWVTERTAGDNRRAGPILDTDSSSTALLQFTSGTTSKPRGVMLSHENLLSNSKSIRDTFGHTRSSQGVIWLPPFHDMGLVGGILQPVFAGFPCALMAPMVFYRRPLRWLRAIADFGGTTSGGPNFAFELCTRRLNPEKLQGVDLSSWEVAFCGAEPINATTLLRFAEQMAPFGFQKKALLPCYGLAEATLQVTARQRSSELLVGEFKADALSRGTAEAATLGTPNGAEAPAPSSSEAEYRRIVSCGTAAEGYNVSIIDAKTGDALDEGRVGEVCVTGPSVSQGYWGNEQATREVFKRGKNGDVRLCTGDIGFIHQRQLYVCGRSKEIIILRGRNYYPSEIERIVALSHDVLQGCDGAAFTIQKEGVDRLVVVHETSRSLRPSDSALVNAVRQAVAKQVELQLYALLLVRARSLPRTSSGKVQRKRCSELYSNGALKPLLHFRIDEEVEAPLQVSASKPLTGHHFPASEASKPF